MKLPERGGRISCLVKSPVVCVGSVNSSDELFTLVVSRGLDTRWCECTSLLRQGYILPKGCKPCKTCVSIVQVLIRTILSNWYDIDGVKTRVAMQGLPSTADRLRLSQSVGFEEASDRMQDAKEAG